MITFGDAADADYIPYSYAALYDADCAYPCPPQKAARWDKAHTRWITQRGLWEASILDFEQLTRDFQDPALVGQWLADREDHHEGRPAWIYSDLSNAYAAATAAGDRAYMWWISTLDNTVRSRQELVQLLLEWNVPPAVATYDRIAAQQVMTRDNEYDYNICFAGW